MMRRVKCWRRNRPSLWQYWKRKHIYPHAPKQWILQFTECIHGTNRNVTVGIWFSCCELAEEHTKRKLTTVDRMRKIRLTFLRNFSELMKTGIVFLIRFRQNFNHVIVCSLPPAPQKKKICSFALYHAHARRSLFEVSEAGHRRILQWYERKHGHIWISPVLPF
jgi:hypothetical protein